MTKKVYIKSYGCQMNVYDSERMADILGEHGFDVSGTPDAADLVILNTCHIREKAAEKVYSDIGRLRGLKEKRRKSGAEMTIAVAGCVGQAEGAEIMRRAPAVELVFGPQTYHRLPELLNRVEAEKQTKPAARVLDTDFPIEEKFDFLAKTWTHTGPSAFLTIQEGCDKFCSFCVVPYTRGGEYSRAAADILRDARALVARGTKEITLLGQNVNAYHGAGVGGGETGLGGLIRALAEIDGLERIRYTTSHPRDMDDDLIAVHHDLEKCMPYLHLPVQSGSDAILARMNRRHKAADYLALVDKIRAARPDIALSSDFIVGFPEESEQDFRATLKLVRDVGYAQAYSFKYSPRPGTPAAEATGQVPEPVKAERLAELQALLNAQQRAFNQSSIGAHQRVLFEREGKYAGQAVGRGPYMQAVHVSLGKGPEHHYVTGMKGGGAVTPQDIMGRIVDVEITDAGPNSLAGKLADAQGAQSAA